ncbi:HBL/NHE enterotoxin family protein [Bacillus cereus]|uniref:HBL/NHE enterotoxin family protein n=1 Tax=Bacillus cereus TaxID=1396 RepID=UPI0018CEDE06|nr:HBL/NHE enterotoxin family protein [Bacillus cereus]MBG9612219.1 hypothetical protein [Bacillus cereus]
MKKICLIGLVTTTLSTSCFLSGHTLAAPLSGDQQIHIQQLAEVHALSNSIRMLGRQTPLVQAYGLVILQQPNAKVKAMSGLTLSQTFAKNNVREWLDEYDPQIVNLNQEMMRCNVRFNNYYNKLVELSKNLNGNKQTTTDFIAAVDQLQQQVQETNEHLKPTGTLLKQFNEQVKTDSKALSEKAKLAIGSLEGGEGEIEKARKDIKRLQEEIQTNLTTILNRPGEIIKGTINIGTDIFKAISKTADSKILEVSSIGSLSESLMSASDSNTRQAVLKLQEKQKELLAVIQGLSQTEIQATEITCIEEQVNSFADLISRQVNTFENAVGDWGLFEEKLTQLKTQVHTEANVKGTDVQKQLTQLKEWNDTLYKQTKQFEDTILQVTVK